MDACVVFLHVPKTAGTTLNGLMVEHYAPDNFKVGVWGGVRRSLDELRALTADESLRFRCVHGHIPYGVHAHVARPCRYISVFRHPVERVVSWYRHRLRKGQLDGSPSLAEYVQSGAFEIENGMTKRLAGKHLVDGVARRFGGGVAEPEATAQDFALARAPGNIWVMLLARPGC